MPSFPSRIGQLSRLTLTIAALALAGCGNECDPDAPPSCDGNATVFCEWTGDGLGSHTLIERTQCQVACAMVGKIPECVLSPQPVAECHGVATTCFQGQVTSCDDDFPTSAMACAPDAHCIDSSCGPICALSDTPEPRCAMSQGFCDGDTLVSCDCGHVQSREDCGAGQCITHGGTEFCARSPTVDARCGDPDQPDSGFCVGDTGFYCAFGYVTSTLGCGKWTCVPNPGAGPSCVL
jgi:hypothetical protein